jgi:hypothetical protein
VKDGKPTVCEEKLRSTSTEYNQEDLLMCNNSTDNYMYREYLARMHSIDAAINPLDTLRSTAGNTVCFRALL